VGRGVLLLCCVVLCCVLYAVLCLGMLCFVLDCVTVPVTVLNPENLNAPWSHKAVRVLHGHTHTYAQMHACIHAST